MIMMKPIKVLTVIFDKKKKTLPPTPRLNTEKCFLKLIPILFSERSFNSAIESQEK